jgi:hypothetical protein
VNGRAVGGFLLALLTCVFAPPTARAQTASVAETEAATEVGEEMATLRSMIDRVENQRWVLIPSRGSLMAISPEQAGELFTLALLEGSMHPDSIETHAQRLRAATRERLVLLKQQLAEMEAGRWPAGRGPNGSWVLHCTGDYPSTIRGTVETLRVDSDGRFGFALMIQTPSSSTPWVWAAPVGRIRMDYGASGAVQGVHLNSYGNWVCAHDCDRSTLKWSARVELIQRSSRSSSVDGVIHGQGTLELTDDPGGSCVGSWAAPESP